MFFSTKKEIYSNFLPQDFSVDSTEVNAKDSQSLKSKLLILHF